MLFLCYFSENYYLCMNHSHVCARTDAVDKTNSHFRIASDAYTIFHRGKFVEKPQVQSKWICPTVQNIARNSVSKSCLISEVRRSFGIRIHDQPNKGFAHTPLNISLWSETMPRQAVLKRPCWEFEYVQKHKKNPFKCDLDETVFSQ
jgi:hypothetical protein